MRTRRSFFYLVFSLLVFGTGFSLNAELNSPSLPRSVRTARELCPIVYDTLGHKNCNKGIEPENQTSKDRTQAPSIKPVDGLTVASYIFGNIARQVEHLNLLQMPRCTTGTCGQTVTNESRVPEVQGLVNLETFPGLQVVKEQRYRSSCNFIGDDMYGDYDKIELHEDAAEKLLNAQNTLKRINPNYAFIAYDCFRPANVQKKLWGAVEGGPFQRYVARPGSKSKHTQGKAIDLSIIDLRTCTTLDVGSFHDDLTGSPGPELENTLPPEYVQSLASKDAQWFANNGSTNCSEKASATDADAVKKCQVHNRRFLKKIMTGSGFNPLGHEWWHFSID